MKMQNLLAVLSKLLVSAVMVLALTGAANTQAASFTNQLTIRNQTINTGIVTVDSATAAADSWVVIYRNPNFKSTEIVGKAPVHAGLNRGVKVVVSLPLINTAPMLWAVLQSDNGTPGVFEWGESDRPYNDAPVNQNGRLVAVAFATTVGPMGNVVSNALAKITVHDQSVASGFVLIDSVTIDQAGWIVFYRNPNFTPGEIIGFAPVYPGTNTNVRAVIDTAKLGDRTHVFARLHSDTGFQGVFEYATPPLAAGLETEASSSKLPLADYPIVQKNKYVTASFSTLVNLPQPNTLAPKGANAIVIHNQNINAGMVSIDSVTAAQNGYVVIYREANLGAGEIIGYAPVYKGLNTGVKVVIDTTKVGDQPTLWAMLHVDGGLQGMFEWGFKGRQYADPPVFQNGAYMATGFGTAAQ